jgi:hypothetical protein
MEYALIRKTNKMKQILKKSAFAASIIALGIATLSFTNNKADNMFGKAERIKSNNPLAIPANVAKAVPMVFITYPYIVLPPPYTLIVTVGPREDLENLVVLPGTHNNARASAIRRVQAL